MSVDVVIVGAGSAGMFAMSQVRKRGLSFRLIENGPFGTTCARVGCMPSKALIHVLEGRHPDVNKGDMPKMGKVRQLRDMLVGGISSRCDSLVENGSIIKGTAKVLSPREVEVSGHGVITANHGLILATGSKPVVPPPWRSLVEAGLAFTTDDIFEIPDEKFPSSVCVVGLGVIGLELGHALHAMGTRVIGVDMLTRVGGVVDEVVAKEAEDMTTARFPVHLGVKAEIMAEPKGGVRVRAEGALDTVFDKVLLSVGRSPCVAGLGLENLGVPLNRGLPAFSPKTMEVEGVKGVFITGDLTGDRPLQHEAHVEGVTAGYNIWLRSSGKEPQEFKRKPMIAVTFTKPNIAFCGMSLPECEEKYGKENVVVGTFYMKGCSRAKVMGPEAEKGVIRVYANKSDGQLLGGALCAERGENMISTLLSFVFQELTVWQALKMPFYHPVLEEGLESALIAAAKKVDGFNDLDIPLELLPQ